MMSGISQPQMSRSKSTLTVFMWSEKLVVQPQINHIAVRAVIRLFQWPPLTQWRGWNMIRVGAGTGITSVGVSEIYENQRLSAHVMLLDIEMIRQEIFNL